MVDRRRVNNYAGSREDDHNWPEPDRVGRQELEVKLGKEHISFTVRQKKRTAAVVRFDSMYIGLTRRDRRGW